MRGVDLKALESRLDKLECCCVREIPLTEGEPIGAPTNNQIFRFDQSTGILYYWDGDSWENYNLTVVTSSVTESGAATLSFGAAGHYIFTGTTATWSLPTISAALIGTEYSIKNRGSGDLTIDVTGGGTTIYDFAAVTNIVIPAGEAREITQDSTYWNIH